jgi:hypothetical protein
MHSEKIYLSKLEEISGEISDVLLNNKGFVTLVFYL